MVTTSGHCCTTEHLSKVKVGNPKVENVKVKVENVEVKNVKVEVDYAAKVKFKTVLRLSRFWASVVYFRQ